MGYDDYDYDDDSPKESSGDSNAVPLLVILAVVALVLAGAGLVFFRFAGATGLQASHNETSAIGALKTISTAQTLHREGDKDGDGVFDYAASLQELGQSNLIDAALASGTKRGFVFETHNGPQVEFEWFATADPIEPGVTGQRFYYVDHTGVLYYSLEGPIQGPLDFTRLPAGVKVLGR